jgi:hypothetical protein
VEEDLLLESPKLGRWLEAEFLTESPPEAFEATERVGLSARPILGEHELAHRTFVERSLIDKTLELTDQLAREASLQVSVYSILEAAGTELLKPSDLCSCELVVGEFLERVTLPQSKGGSEVICCSLRVSLEEV